MCEEKLYDVKGIFKHQFKEYTIYFAVTGPLLPSTGENDIATVDVRLESYFSINKYIKQKYE